MQGEGERITIPEGGVIAGVIIRVSDENVEHQAAEQLKQRKRVAGAVTA
ncbi:cation transport regulator ChaC [Devosia subaequoris]|uniref:Cation transport regulator ChaC n=1 Tax=Devosia subaequoris TaxID=395930 RepID=A0A7W6ND45_9HYPH|nr:hypothetical protein [Devosia subaequoris]MBB4053351.1 cation transport regulator ChaC [Devosia subaequoris]MCP1211509.1 hypothetical protein [Devosia subaequoris]